MRRFRYVRRSLFWYRRTNFAIVCGCAIATAVLAGALLVGHSVRASLREIALSRLGAASLALVSTHFFRATLASDFSPSFSASPIIAIEGAAVHESSGARAGGVSIIGIDGSFYKFHGVAGAAPSGRDAYLSPALAREFTAKAGDALLLKLEEPSEIPREFLHGRKDRVARTLRLTVAASVTPPAMGDFSLRPSQAETRAVFVSLSSLARELGQVERANTILLSDGPPEAAIARLNQDYQLEDLGLRLRDLGTERGVALEHVSTLIDDEAAQHALSIGKTLGLLQRPVFTWLANSIVVGARRIPYSLVAGVDPATLSEINDDRPIPDDVQSPIVLNSWAVDELGAKPGDEVRLEYYVWSSEGRLETKSAVFAMAASAPLKGLAADRHFAPEYPGITDKMSVTGWDPPFPIDLARIQPRDEEYWKLYRATPKAWIPLEAAQKLWANRYGSLTSIRYPEAPPEFGRMLRGELDPLGSHFRLLPVREQAIQASAGSTDFGQYFLYFSFFVIVSALLLMGLFFRLGVEQRQREIGLLNALGFNQRELRTMFLGEGVLLAAAGSLLGVPTGVAYAAFILHGLRTWWSGATGTNLLSLHVEVNLLIPAVAGGFAVALLAIWLTLRGWRDLSPRGLMAGPGRGRASRLQLWMTAPPFAFAIALLVASASGGLAATAGFFGAGVSLLTAGLMSISLWLRRPFGPIPAEPGFRSSVALASRNTAWRPGRSLFSVALIASATFLLVSLEAFRHGREANAGKKSGAGGYEIYAESQAPLIPNPNSQDGRESLNLGDIPSAMRWAPFRLKPGDDVSCLNLYQPRNPRVIAAPPEFLADGGFVFAGSTAASPETEANPWMLLEGQLNAGIVPAIVDETSMQYVLHRKLGEVFEIERPGSAPVRFRLVGALRGSVFQSEIIISEPNFLRLFPDNEGYRVFLIHGSPAAIPALEEALSDYGFDATSTADRLAAYHRVNNTYISTFQALGLLGLVLGTLGLSVVLLRNTLERRRELGLLRATGYTQAHLRNLLFLENLELLIAGLGLGIFCALLAIGPTLLQRGLLLPVASVFGLSLLILLAGAAATWIAVRAAMHEPLLEALRSE